MQVNHGKAAPLRRLKAGDGVVYYSPTTHLGEADRLPSFTAIGIVHDSLVYQGDMGAGFKPWRRDVAWVEANEATILPMMARLELTRGKTNWGYQLRFGLIEISQSDFAAIANAMDVTNPMFMVVG